MSFVDIVMESPWVYRLWQAPFASSKMAPVIAHNDLDVVGSVLDVGCGPGTNAKYFSGADYTGVDINGRYISYARKRFGGRFVVADVRALPTLERVTFDFVMVNSLLHHLNTTAAQGLLRALKSLVAESGYVHIVELVTPPPSTVASRLAAADRGQFGRSVEEWTELCADSFELVLVEPYVLARFGVPLWYLVYLKGRPK